jgi:hypothetical protein
MINVHFCITIENHTATNLIKRRRRREQKVFPKKKFHQQNNKLIESLQKAIETKFSFHTSTISLAT